MADTSTATPGKLVYLGKGMVPLVQLLTYYGLGLFWNKEDIFIEATAIYNWLTTAQVVPYPLPCIDISRHTQSNIVFQCSTEDIEWPFPSTHHPCPHTHCSFFGSSSLILLFIMIVWNFASNNFVSCFMLGIVYIYNLTIKFFPSNNLETCVTCGFIDSVNKRKTNPVSTSLFSGAVETRSEVVQI